MTHSRPAAGAGIYQITVLDTLDEGWSEWFSGMSITVAPSSDGSPKTTLLGTIDQSALHGMLAKIRDLNLILVSVSRLEPGQIIHQDHPPEPPLG
jgi:hypothetical protein